MDGMVFMIYRVAMEESRLWSCYFEFSQKLVLGWEATYLTLLQSEQKEPYWGKGSFSSFIAVVHRLYLRCKIMKLSPLFAAFLSSRQDGCIASTRRPALLLLGILL
jgi:hypothetical protein